MFARLDSIGLFGVDAYGVSVEADVARGMPSFDIVGLPDASVREARDRVRAAAKNNGYDVPLGRITVNLAPADVKKAGPLYDLPILLSILCASGAVTLPAPKTAYIGELSLSGEVKAVNGVLPMAIYARESGFARLFIPAENAAEASAVDGIEIYAVTRFTEILSFLSGECVLTPVSQQTFSQPPEPPFLDFADVKGQQGAKRALEVAAAGGHNVILVGSPGAGKSMLAKRLPGILPDLTFDEAIQVTKLHSIAGLLPKGQPMIRTRPFRSPHHTVSPAALSGGGSIPKPGEISLAHCGVLFLDELPEFNRIAIEVMRQPIEDGTVTIARVNGTLSYPCAIMLVAAMNPCPCGYFGHPTRPCRCSDKAVTNYLSRISGPLLDRVDIHVEVMPVEYKSLSGSSAKEESSADIRERVNRARAVAQERFSVTNASCNARLPDGVLNEVCSLTDDAKRLLERSFERLGLSARAHNRILKVARTIADLDESKQIDSKHISEAIQYRSLDRKYWQHRL